MTPLPARFQRRPIPPPERLSGRDIVHIVFGFLMVPLGVVILYQTARTIKSATGYLVGLAFLGFGVHRLSTAYLRLRMLRRSRAASFDKSSPSG